MSNQFTLPDSAYADGVLPSMDQLKHRESFDIDWIDHDQMIKKMAKHTAKALAPEDIWDMGQPFYTDEHGSVVKPGMAPAAEGSSFLAELTYDATFFNKCRFEKITRKENNIYIMGSDNRLQSLRFIENEEPPRDNGKQILHLHDRRPGQPTFRTKKLQAEAFISYIEVPWTMMEDNLVGGRFLQEFLNSIKAQQEYNMEELCMYAIKDENTTDPDGLNVNDGLFKQLYDQHDIYIEQEETVTDKPLAQGIYSGIEGTGTDPVPIDFSDVNGEGGYTAIDQLCDMETQYLTQLGSQNYEFLVSLEVFGLIKRMMRQRETVGGDRILFEGGAIRLDGVPITPCQSLSRPKNGFDQCILLGDFGRGFVNGMREDFQTHTEWNQDRQRWVSDTKIYWGSLLLYENDILCAPVEGLPTQQAGSGDSDPSNP